MPDGSDNRNRYRYGTVEDTYAAVFIAALTFVDINPLNAELNPIRHLLALVGARHIVHVSRIRVNYLYYRVFWHSAFQKLLYSMT
jgi:hypothetical protein